MVSYHDLYIIKWLLQEVEKPDTKIIWQRLKHGIYLADFNEGGAPVRFEVSIVQARVVIKFTSPGLGEVQVVEPIKNIFSLMTKYDTPEEAELAETMNRLLAVIAKQHAARELHDMETEGERKQAIFRRLMGGSD